jgi:hypothetical protein
MNPKREKMVTLRINDESYRVIKDFAANHGLSVNAFLNSVIDSQAEWHIPTSSYDAVTVPKAMLGALFNMASREHLDPLAKQWATEARNIILLSGNDLTLDSVLDFGKRVSKYFMGTDIRISASGDQRNRPTIIIVRHDMGDNFSYFVTKAFGHLFEMIRIRVSIDSDPTTVFIRIEPT